MGRKKQRRPLLDPERERTTLGDLLRAAGIETPPQAAADPPAAPEAKKGAAPLDLSGVTKAVLRRTRKGRAGKTVTLVEGLGLDAERLAAVARAMRKGLGSGCAVEVEGIVVQGDIAPRVESWLTSRGVRRVVLP